MRAIVAALAVDFVAILIWAVVTSEGFGEGMAYVIGHPYGIATAADLILGLCLFSVIVFLNEESKLKATLWTLSFFMIGNPAPAVYLIINLPKLKEKLG